MKAADIIKKYKLKEKKWTHKGFHGVLHFFFAVGEEAVKPLYDYYKDTYELTVFFFHDNYGDWYWNNADMERLAQSFIDDVNKNPRVLEDLLDEWHQRIKLFNQIMRKINETDLSKISNQQLLDLYNEWYQAYIEEYSIAIGFQDAVSMDDTEYSYVYFKITHMWFLNII